MKMTEAQFDLIKAQLKKLTSQDGFYGRKLKGIDIDAIKSQEDFEEQGSSDSDDTGRISIRTSRLRIAVKSTLKHKVDVRILTLNGLTVTTFALEPGETVETRLSNAGVYIVQPSELRFTKKLSVR